MLECPSCGSRNPDDALYCLRCRAPMYSAASPARRRSAPLLEERVPEREWETEERWEEDELDNRRPRSRSRPPDRRPPRREWDDDEDEQYAAYEDEDDYYDDEYEDEYYDERPRPPSAGRPAPLMLVLVGAILLACGCLVGVIGGYFGGNLLLAGGSGGATAEDEIEATVISYWEALGDGDFRAAYGYVAKSSDVSRVDFIDEQEAMGDPSLRLVTVEVGAIDIKGKKAVAEVRAKWQAGDEGNAFVDTRDVKLVREGRKWLILWEGSEFPEPPPTPTPTLTPTPTPAPTQSGCPQGCLEPSENCQIKAVVAEDGRHLYYRPGDPAYDGSVVNTDSGGRWFCTEDEARAAGWVLAPQ